MSPLAAPPYRTAAWVWVALTLAAFGATTLLLARAVAPGGAFAALVPKPQLEGKGEWRFVAGAATTWPAGE